MYEIAGREAQPLAHADDFRRDRGERWRRSARIGDARIAGIERSVEVGVRIAVQREHGPGRSPRT